jgi:hypothetical protein
MPKLAQFSSACLWLSLCSATVYAQDVAPVGETPGSQPPEQPTPPPENAAPLDLQGTIIPGFGFPYSQAAGITGTGILPYSQGPVVTGTGIIPFAQAAAPSSQPLQINETVKYNDNVLFVPQGQSVPIPSRGDFFSTTSITAAPQLFLGQQTLFAHATYGINRYLRDSVLDSDFYSLDAGANWRFTHLCSGTVLAAISQSQVPFSELPSPSAASLSATSGAIQIVKTESLTETAKCGISGHLSVIANSGWSDNQNSSSTANSYTQQQFSTGLEYSVASFNTLRALVTFTEREFTDRSTPGLASNTNETDYQLFYQRNLTPKLNFNGMIGTSQVEATAPAAPGPSSSEISALTYSAALAWNVTPKTTFEISSARGLGPPLAVQADFQKTDVQTLSANYRYSPKLSFYAAVSQSQTSNSTVSGVMATPVLSQVSIRTVSAGFSYTLSPFINSFFSYSYYDRRDETPGVVYPVTLSNLYLFGLTYSH